MRRFFTIYLGLKICLNTSQEVYTYGDDMEKIFTLQEANKIVLMLNEKFTRIFHLKERIETVSKDVQELMGIWGGQILESDNPDNKFYFDRLKEREGAVREFQQNIDEIRESGCIIKDMNEGMADFYCKRNSDTILLCWKYGEEKIKYWHSLQDASRKPIEELAQVS